MGMLLRRHKRNATTTPAPVSPMKETPKIEKGSKKKVQGKGA